MTKGITVKGPDVSASEYATADLYFAAYLQVAGMRMIRHTRYDGRMYFVFDISIGDINALKSAWVLSTGKIAAQPYSRAIKDLKSLCHMS